MSGCTSKLLRHRSQEDAIETFMCKCRSHHHDRRVVPVLFPMRRHFPSLSGGEASEEQECCSLNPLASG